MIFKIINNPGPQGAVVTFIRRLHASNAGIAGVEYGLLCALIVVGLLAGLQGLGGEVGSSYDDTATRVQDATGN